MPRVRGGGHECRKLVDPLLAADLFELPELIQFVGDGDRIDGLPVLVQVEDRPVDLRMRLPVEVAAVHDLADRLDRRRGKEHRA